MNYREQMKRCNRIVIKVGTSTLTYDNGNINLTRIEKLTRVLSDLMNSASALLMSLVNSLENIAILLGKFY